MTPLAKAVATLPDSQLIQMVSSQISAQVAGLIHKSLRSTSSKDEMKAEVENLRNLEIVQLLPNSEKQKLGEICNKALEIIELAP